MFAARSRHAGEAPARKQALPVQPAFTPEPVNPVWSHLALHSGLRLQMQRHRRRVEDWDFTRQEYGQLRTTGRDLTFAAGSGWFPERLKQNLLATLRTVLDPSRTLVATEGINVHDFYHGHLVIPRSATLPRALSTAVSTYEREKNARYAQALGGDSSMVTAQNLPAFRTAVSQTLPFAHRVLELAVQRPDAAVIYHTFERNMPDGMEEGDPRRNWMTPLSDNTPVPYRPPEEGNASSYEINYLRLFHFAFLVNGRGRIHVRPGSIDELTTVTGRAGPTPTTEAAARPDAGSPQQDGP